MTRLSGAEIVIRALEDSGVQFAFGIPGAQNLELYDVLALRDKVRSILVTDEQCASFMADGAWRASGRLSCVTLVPGAGLTHALSGVAEAFMDCVPLLVLSTAVRSDLGKAFQLHDIDQLAIARSVTKAQFHVSDAAMLDDIVRTACSKALEAPCGPVIVEIPANLLVFRTEQPLPLAKVAVPVGTPQPATIDQLADAISMIGSSKRPLLYLGAGAMGAGQNLVALAERLEAPVCTTIQGKGVFPESHPLWLWCGFGPMAPNFVRAIAADCDLTIAIACRFGEVATGSYGLKSQGPLLHVDVDENVFGRNLPAALAICADAAGFVHAVLQEFDQRSVSAEMRATIRSGHKKIRAGWAKTRDEDHVSPPRLLTALQKGFGPEAAFVADSGNGMFEAMECLRLDHPRSFFAPVDFSCMGYSVPAAIGAALAVPGRSVIATVGDGALLMTGLELITASQLDIPVVVVVLRDRQFAQIAQFQKTAYVRTPLSVLADFDLHALCQGMGIGHLLMSRNGDVDGVVAEARQIHDRKRPVLIEAVMDDSFQTFFTKGVVRTNFGRLPWSERVHFVARALRRHLPGAA